MLCPNCNNEIQDGSKACPKCGMSFVQQQPSQSIQQIAAQSELNKMKKDGSSRKMILCAIASFLIAAICIPAKLVIGVIFFAIVGIVSIVYYNKLKDRKEELNNISQGKTKYVLCPNCKSQNIEMNMVQSGSVTQQGTTTISDNVNPLRPFTHTNINHGNVTTSNQYSNKCLCKDCGSVFDKPEILYQ